LQASLGCVTVPVPIAPQMLATQSPGQAPIVLPTVIPSITATPASALPTITLPAPTTVMDARPIVLPSVAPPSGETPPAFPTPGIQTQVNRGPRACPPSVAEDAVTYQLDSITQFDRSSIRDGYNGGIPVLVEKRIDGKLVQSFRATSLSISWPSPG
jgi:hypothetical protein